MNLSPVNAASSTYNLPEIPKAASAQPAASPIEDKVTLSQSALKTNASVDVDHDGDSH